MYSVLDLQKLVQMLSFLGISPGSAAPPHSVVLGGGTDATPGAVGTLLGSNGPTVDPSFQSLASLGIQPAFTFPVPISEGGTGAITAALARVALGVAARGANTDITSLLGPLTITGTGIVNLEAGAGSAPVPMVVQNITALRGVLKTQTPYVHVTGYYAQGDGGGGLYWFNAADTTSPDNFGTIILASDGGRWYLISNGTTTAKQWGAKGDGTTDDLFTIQNALNSSPAGSIIVLTPATYRVSAGITVPSGKRLRGDGSEASIIVGDLAIAAIVTVTDSGDLEAVPLSDLLVTRAAGSVPAGSIGVLITSNNMGTLQDLMVLRSDIAYSVGVVGAATTLGVHLHRCCSGQVTTYHLRINNAVEVTATECRFGRNGGTDFSSTAYVNINGATVDTVRFIACQFNQSGASAVNLLYFTGYASDPNGIITFAQCHVEGLSTNVVSADAGSTNIERLRFIGNSIDMTGVFYQGAAANLSELMLTGNTLDGGVSLTLDQQTQSVVTGNVFGTGGSVLINAGSQVITGNFFAEAVTLQGASVRTVFVGNAIAGGLTNTMTGTTAIANNI